MPRNSAGVYALPQAAFQSNTVIASAAMNSNLNDIAQTLTQSLDTTGKSQMTGQFLAAGGNVNAPGISYSSQPNAGFYLGAANQINVGTNSNAIQSWNADGSTTVIGTANFNTAVVIPNVFGFFSSGTFGWGSTTIKNNFFQSLGANVDVVGFIDGGGAPPTVGYKVWVRCPFAMTVYAWRIAADVTGSATIDVGGAQGNPVNAPSIIGSGNKPTLSGQSFNSANVSGWTQTSFPSDFWLNFYVGSASTITKLNVTLLCSRTSGF